MSSLLRDRPAGSSAMLAAFDDAATLRAALAFEAALARAQAAEGIISDADSAAIGAACDGLDADPAELAEEAAHAGTLAIPLVARLRAALKARHPTAAAAVHRGATSQDVADTALVLQARAALALLGADTERLETALIALTERHAETPALGRTLLQGALPITFGLKTAGWLTGIRAARIRLRREADGALMLQLGGAAGTLAGMGSGETALAVVRRVAEDLGVGVPPTPWHARREAIAGLGAALAILTGAVGKMARDIALLAQNEVAEAFEPRLAGRGGSSAMAHKRNPTGCQVALSAALRAPGLAATLMAGLPQEHERGLGGWQAEAPVLADLFILVHGAVVAMADVAEGLEVDVAAMARNLASAAGVGTDARRVRAAGAKGAGCPGEGLMPFTVRDDGVRLFWRRDGSARKPALLLLNSIGTGMELWDSVVPFLLPAFCVIRMDTRGHGASDAPDGDYSLAMLASDAAAVLDAAGMARAAVCGISLGGMVAMTLALESPGRCSALIVACSSAAMDPAAWDARAATVRAGGTAAIADMAMGRFFSPAFREAKPDVVETTRAALLAQSAGGYAGCCAAIRDMRLLDALPAIHTPTLVIGGTQDVSTPYETHGAAIAAAIPGAIATHLPTAHLPSLEDPQGMAAAIQRFLATPDLRDAAATLYESGLARRREVLGDAWVDRSLANRTPFNAEFQEMITRIAWNEIWTRPGLDDRTRRLLVVAITAALGRWEEFALHVRTGLSRGGFTPSELKEVLMQTAIYAGVPAANTAFAEAGKIIKETETSGETHG